MVKYLPARWEAWVRYLRWEGKGPPLEKGTVVRKGQGR